MTIENKKWLETLKVGDYVAIEERSYSIGDQFSITRILRETPKTFFTSRGDFRKSDGKIIGSYGSYPRPITDKMLQDKKDRALRYWFKEFSGSGVDLNCLRAMKDVFDSWKAKS